MTYGIKDYVLILFMGLALIQAGFIFGAWVAVHDDLRAMELALR